MELIIKSKDIEQLRNAGSINLVLDSGESIKLVYKRSKAENRYTKKKMIEKIKEIKGPEFADSLADSRAGTIRFIFNKLTNNNN